MRGYQHTGRQPVRDLIQVQLINFFVVLYGKSCRVCWLFASSAQFSHKVYGWHMEKLFQFIQYFSVQNAIFKILYIRSEV